MKIATAKVRYRTLLASRLPTVQQTTIKPDAQMAALVCLRKVREKCQFSLHPLDVPSDLFHLPKVVFKIGAFDRERRGVRAGAHASSASSSRLDSASTASMTSGVKPNSFSRNSDQPGAFSGTS